MRKLIIFTDLDGTLLDADTYSFESAVPAIKLLKKKNIPLIICSSKTEKEIERYREKLGNRHPFISENGGGIFIPKHYFGDTLYCLQFTVKEDGNYDVIRLGAKYSELRKALLELHSEGFDIKGFGDMTPEELAEIANMSIEEAKLAKERNFDEPFIFSGKESEIQKLFDAIKSRGFNHTQGQFLHILGDSDKGKAVSIVIDLYKSRFENIMAIAIGDNTNDIPMLEKVDIPIIVQKPDGTYNQQIDIPKLVMADGIGPAGWNRIIVQIVESYN